MAAIDVRDRIVEEARAMLGCPFRHHGRSRAGVDCAGLVILARNAAVDGPPIESLDYPPRPEQAMVFATVSRFADRIPLEDACPGDLAILRRNGASTHIGILTDRGVIHASPKVGVVEHDRGSTFGGLIVAAYRLKGLDPWRS